jgi:hypothetical protein
MTDRGLWLDHPLEGTPPAAAATGAEEPLWESHPTAEQHTLGAPAQGYDLYRKVTDTANRGLTFGLSDKVGARFWRRGTSLA